jgi:hypothetical protein
MLSSDPPLIVMCVGFGGHFLTSAVFDFLAAYPKTKVELRQPTPL